MPVEIKDLAGLSEPIKKLIEVVSAGLGTYYRPKAIKEEADARAYEKKVIARAEAEAKAESTQIAIKSAVSHLEFLNGVAPELAERARQRLLAREVEGQLNIEAIAEHAVAQLPYSVSDEPVSSDWRRKFFSEAENICEADMQILWGKVLAGELTTPGSFGARTLETLKQLSRGEAELFRKLCGLAMSDGWIALPSNDINTALKPYGVSYGELLTLRDAGLVMTADHLIKNFYEVIPNPAKAKLVISNNGVMVEISGPGMVNLSVPVVALTKAGRELQRLIEPEANNDYLKMLGTYWRTLNVVVKRGIPVPQSDGVSLITFEQDL